MKKILYVHKLDDEEVKVETLSVKNIDHLHLIGKRFDKILIEIDVNNLSDEKLLELRLCQYKEDDNFITMIF